MSRASGLSRVEKQERTRDALLRAAAKLFCRRGLEGTSVDELVVLPVRKVVEVLHSDDRSDRLRLCQLCRCDAADAKVADEAKRAAFDFCRKILGCNLTLSNRHMAHLWPLKTNAVTNSIHAFDSAHAHCCVNLDVAFGIGDSRAH